MTYRTGNRSARSNRPTDRQLAFLNSLVEQCSALGHQIVVPEDVTFESVSSLIDSAKTVLASLKASAAQLAKANGIAWAEGAVDFEGTVIEASGRQTDFGYKYFLVIKLDDGRTAEITHPARLQGEYGDFIVGARVRVEAKQVTLSRKDHTKAYPKRPKVTLLSECLALAEHHAAERAWHLTQAFEQASDGLFWSCSHQADYDRKAQGQHVDERYRYHEHKHYGTHCQATVQVMSDVWDSCGAVQYVPTERGSWYTTVAPKPEPQALVDWYRNLPAAERQYVERFEGRNLPYRNAGYWFNWGRTDHTYEFSH